MGHLFVAQGDLTKLACDSLLIPCDSRLNVNSVWAGILPPGLKVGDKSDWLRLGGRKNKAGVIALPDNDNRRVSAFIAVDADKNAAPEDVVDRLWKALDYVSKGLDHADGRVTHLIGIPLVGTGHGGLEGRRARSSRNSCGVITQRR